MKRVVREVMETAILGVFVFLVLQLSIQNFRVDGSSMEPTLKDGEYVMVNKAVYMHINVEPLAKVLPFIQGMANTQVYPFHPPMVGDIVVFRFPLDPSQDFVKRVVAEPGDTVEILRGVVMVNDKVLQESYTTQTTPWTHPPLTLGEDQYYVLGDNRMASNDSREWGPLPLVNIVGKAWVTYWPLDRLNTFLGSLWLW